MNTTQIREIKELLNTPKNIVIIPHKNPDGDAIGSTLGLHHYLSDLGHNSSVITPNDYPTFLKWIPGQETITKYDSAAKEVLSLVENADIIFTLDFNDFSRVGDMQSVLANAKATFIMIDHHQQPSDYATYMYSDTSMSSTCQMVYHFIDMLGDTSKISADIATSLYVGIMTDTGSFRFRSTTNVTHKVIAHLIECGADNTAIHQNIYDANTYSKLQLQGVALKNLKIIPEYKAAYITLSQKELDDHNFKKGDTDGFVNLGLSVTGIIFALIFIENKGDKIIKISLRSKGDFSVNDFSRNHFEGGGHHNAAGGKSNLSLEQTIEKFISILPTYKNELNS